MLLVGPAGHRQDAAGARRRRRSEGAVLQPERIGVRGDVRRRRRRARARSVRAGREPRRRASCSSTSSTRSARCACRARWAATRSASRRSTSCSPRWTASTRARPSSSWARPTGPRCSTRRCSGPGRFDRQVLVDKPDINGREQVLKIHTRNVKLVPEIDLRVIAGRTAGFAGADLANLVNEAALLAARKDKTAVDMRDFDEAIDRLIAGLEKKRVMNAEGTRDRRVPRVGARHRRHASLPGLDPVHKISIVQRGLRRARLHDAAAVRGSLPDDAHRPAAPARRCCSAGGRPRRSRSARSRPARRTTCSAPATSRGRWSPSSA